MKRPVEDGERFVLTAVGIVTLIIFLIFLSQVEGRLDFKDVISLILIFGIPWIIVSNILYAILVGVGVFKDKPYVNSREHKSYEYEDRR